jgi:uncharacterized damage-inducible protein DinB
MLDSGESMLPQMKLLLPEFDAEMASTRRMLAAEPEEKFGWRRHAKSFTMRRLAGHAAEIPSRPRDILREGRLEVVPEMRRENFGFVPATHAEPMEKFDACVRQSKADLQATSDHALEETWVLKRKSQTILWLPRQTALRTWGFSQGIPHRAQLSVYLRLNDVKVPGMYGLSADER